MDIVRQSPKRARRLCILGEALATVLIISVPCSAVTVPAATAPKLTTLYNFPGGGGGSFLEAGLVFNPSTGALYGTTADGGAHGWGTVYQLLPGTGGIWTQSLLYSFNPISVPGDGASPQAGLYLNTTTGVLYGTTTYGGTSDNGTVFSLTPSTGGTWTEKVLYSFNGSASGDGSEPQAALILSSKTGVLYGTTYAGGTAGFGAVFELLPQTGGIWTEKVLYSFTGLTDGANPVTSLVQATTQVLYGTTYAGGASGFGTVFQLVPATGGVWTQSVLYSFTNGTDGSSPESPLLLHYTKNGSGGTVTGLYGSTFWGGGSSGSIIPYGCPLGGYIQAGCGTIFSLTAPATTGSPWTFAVLYTFTGTGTDGAHPYQNLSLNSTGDIYGTTFSGGSTSDSCFGPSYAGCGTAFIVKPPATQGAAWTELPLHDFNGDDGGGPNGLTAGASGSGIYYGSTYVGGTAGGYGSVFQLAPQ